MTWRSLGDSNPCFRRERATSWAARRRELAACDIALNVRLRKRALPFRRVRTVAARAGQASAEGAKNMAIRTEGL
jgi:hypothetical protein